MFAGAFLIKLLLLWGFCIASGAGAELRQALGTAVFFGMLGVTAFGLIFTPTFYVVARSLSHWSAERRARRGSDDHGTALPVPAE